MGKEQDLRDKILKASPFLDTFLYYNGPGRGTKLTELFDAAIEKMAKLNGKLTVASIVYASANFMDHLGLFLPPANSESPEEVNLDHLGRTAGLIALGFEIGGNTDTTENPKPMVKETVRKVIEQDILFSDSKTNFLATKVVEALLLTGFAMNNPNEDSLKPFEAFLNKLG